MEQKLESLIDGGATKPIDIKGRVTAFRSIPSITRGLAMPIFGYQCKERGETFQTLVRTGDEPTCPSCGAAELDQQLSLIGSPAKSGDSDAAACSNAGAGPSCATCPGAAMFG
jgi:putative FmdB family regulatory protein